MFVRNMGEIRKKLWLTELFFFLFSIFNQPIDLAHHKSAKQGINRPWPKWRRSKTVQQFHTVESETHSYQHDQAKPP